MPAMRGKFALGLTLLLAAATAVADTAVTANEVISCSVVLADTSSLNLRLAQGGSGILNPRDIVEVRMSDSSRVAEMAALLLGTKVTPDSGQRVPPPEAGAQATPERRADTQAGASAGYDGSIDTLARNASPAAMEAKCRAMTVVLRDCGRSNDTVFDLFYEVDREQEALRGIRPRMVRQYVQCVLPAGLLGAGIGIAISMARDPCDPSPIAPIAGCIGGPLIGAVIGAQENAKLVARHRGTVNDLIRRVNRAVAEP